MPDGKFEDPYFQRVAGNVRSLNERGLDAMVVWERQAHEHGLWFIPSLRMNDIHKDHVDRWPSLRSGWEREQMSRVTEVDVQVSFRQAKQQRSP